MSRMIDTEKLQKLLPRDDEGFFHMEFDVGQHLAFAPAKDDGSGPDRGTAMMADFENKTMVEVPFLSIFGRDGNTLALVNHEDFFELAEAILSGEIPFQHHH